MLIPYTTIEAVKSQVNARLGQYDPELIPAHWDELCGRALARGHQRVIGILTGQGYTLDQINNWTGRETYNLDYAVCYAFMFGGFRIGETDTNKESQELARLDKELMQEFVMIADDGTIIRPNNTASDNEISYGRLDAFKEEIPKADYLPYTIYSKSSV
jgi:hypothetical protein